VVPEAVACQDEDGRLRDVLTMLWSAVRASKDCGSLLPFGAQVRKDNREDTPPLAWLKAVCGPQRQG
jgi:hypothetical protein